MRHFLDTIDTIPAGMGFSYFHPFHLCWLGGIALAITNVFGGFDITHKMLKMIAGKKR